MIWLVLFVISFTNGQHEIPKISMDVDQDYNGDPAGFKYLKVQTNEPVGVVYMWMKDNKRITKDTQPPFTGYNSETLWVSSPGKQYAGVYQFVMQTSAGTIAGRNITVDFTYLGEFDPNLPSEVTKNVVIGQAYYLACPKHEPGRHIFYKWGLSSEITGAKFMPDKANYIILNEGTLFFSHITPDDVIQFNNKGWKCGMEAAEKGNKFKWAKQTITLNVTDTNMTAFGPMIVTKLPQNKTFQEGETISMKCAATGRPTPVYVWSRIDVYGKKHAVEVGKGGMSHDGSDTRILVIKPAKRDHAGRYFCTATIGNKNDTVEGSLSFRVKPSWVGKPIESATPSIYDSYTWTCNATGFPQPTYKWFKNHEPVVSSARLHANGGSLTFKKLAKTDSAMYQCVAYNELDNIYQSAYMGVRAEKPVFDSNTGKQTLFLAGKGVIKCKAKAAPTAKNTWFKDGVEIDFSIPRYTLLNNEDLVVDTVSKQDVGNYTCTATNEFGSDTKKISVQVAGEITFIAEPKDVVTTRGSHIKLGCEAKVDKHSANKVTIKYKWKFNRKDLPLNGTIVWSSENTLNFIDAKVSQSGVYECIAYIDKPSYAEKRRQATVFVKGPPESPNKVKIDGDCGAFTAKLLWYITANHYEPIKYFVIQMATTFEQVWHNLTDRIPANKDEFTVTGLSPGAQYRFRVMAINEIGTSPPSEPTVFRDCETPEKAPAKCPPIEAIPGKAGELTLKWEKMKLIDQNGINFEYVLEYNSHNPAFSANKTFSAAVQDFKIPNAGYYRLWSYKIYGKNRVGPGPYCSGTANSGQDAPKMAPIDLTVKTFGDTFLVLQWKAISMSRGSVDGYKLKYFQVSVSSRTRRSTSGKVCDSRNPCVEDISGGSRTSIRLDGLFPYTKYRIAVYGYNSGGAGPESSISVSTKQGVPEPPQQVKLVGYAKYIKLVWKEPARPNGVITAYNVTIHRDADPKLHFSDIVNRNARKYVFGGLEPKKDYIVSIQAKTTYFGEKSVHVVSTKTLQVPAKPDVAVVEGIGENGVNVTFQEGKPEKGFPEEFVVVYRVKDEEGKGNWTQTEPIELYGPDSKPYLAIYGLNKSKEYEIATFAVNEKGNSGWSDIQTVVPGSSIKTPPTVVKTTENNNATDTEAQNTAVHKQSWFVAVVVIVIFLLIVLFVALLITRKRGERYPVGKREKKRAGILDNSEEPDYNTYPLKPPRQNGNGVPRQNSGGSLPNKDPDRDSLDEYGEDRFDEDAASLIGAYNDDRRHHNTVDEPEFV